MIAKVNYLSENIKLGKKVLESFNKTFPNVESHSMAQLRLLKESNPKIKEEMAEVCKKLFSKLTSLKADVYEKAYTQSDYISALKSAIKKYNIADCGHRTDVIINSLRIQGKSAKKVEMVITDNLGKQKSNHIFPVIAMKNNANIDNPQTWGENAVIVDAWANMVMKANDGINFLKKTVGFLPAAEKVKFNIIS